MVPIYALCHTPIYFSGKVQNPLTKQVYLSKHSHCTLGIFIKIYNSGLSPTIVKLPSRLCTALQQMYTGLALVVVMIFSEFLWQLAPRGWLPVFATLCISCYENTPNVPTFSCSFYPCSNINGDLLFPLSLTRHYIRGRSKSRKILLLFGPLSDTDKHSCFGRARTVAPRQLERMTKRQIRPTKSSVISRIQYGTYQSVFHSRLRLSSPLLCLEAKQGVFTYIPVTD